MIFRHGLSPYKEGNRHCTADELATICDLTDEGVSCVIKNACNALKHLKVHDNVSIVSSPLPRTVHSARLISQVLAGEGFKVTSRFDGRLGEVENFDWALFRPLFEGGKFEWEGATVTVDPKDTNPEGLDYATYFNRDILHDLPDNVVRKLPASYVERIRRFEKASDVAQRMLTFLKKHREEPGDYSVIVTHDAWVGPLVKHFTRGRQSGLPPGTFLAMIHLPGESYVSEVDGLREGLPSNIFNLLKKPA